MGFQELCLLCYETQRLRHSEAVCVAQFLLPIGMAGCSVGPYLLAPMYQISPNSPLSDHLWPGSLVFFCSEACIRWYGARTNRQKHTGTDHGGYRTEKVTKMG